jgi:mono/diheme cytochrome c family protein
MLKFLTALVVSLSLLCFLVFAQDDKIARGKYLVEEVGKCQDCHTPHLMGTGEIVKSAWLKGATLDIISVSQPPTWRSKAPDITSTGPMWARWGDEGIVKLLETGVNPRGSKLGQPMPAYTLTHDDAVAVTAFLKSLK